MYHFYLQKSIIGSLLEMVDRPVGWTTAEWDQLSGVLCSSRSGEEGEEW